MRARFANFISVSLIAALFCANRRLQPARRNALWCEGIDTNLSLDIHAAQTQSTYAAIFARTTLSNETGVRLGVDFASLRFWYRSFHIIRA